MNTVTQAETSAVAETLKSNASGISLEYLQLAFERTYKGPVGTVSASQAGLSPSQFAKRKGGAYLNDRLQNIFQGFCLALQSINDSSISFSDLKNGK